MKMPTFVPPIRRSEIASTHETEDGIDRSTIELVDNEGHEFSLTVEAAVQHDQRIIDEFVSGVEAEGDEPVFVIPGDHVSPEDIGRVLEAPASLLGKFLVEQESEGTSV